MSNSSSDNNVELIFMPLMLLGNVPVNRNTISFVAWATYNEVGAYASAEDIKKYAENFITKHKFCINQVNMFFQEIQELKNIGKAKDVTNEAKQKSEEILLELKKHPKCLNVVAHIVAN